MVVFSYTSAADLADLPNTIVRGRQPTLLTLTLTRVSTTEIATITLGNGNTDAVVAAQPTDTTTPTTSPAAASSSDGISITAVVVMGLVLGISSILFLLCCIYRDRCVCFGKGTKPKPIKGRRYPVIPGRRGPAGPPGPPVSHDLI
jgi:hypothetical protein